jgi:hypothetical protein
VTRTVAPLAITNVELALYALLVAWAVPAAGRLLRRPRMRRPSPLEIAVVFWAAVTLVSALAAPVERGTALKFALRSAGGARRAGATRLATTARGGRVLETVAVGAVLAAVVAPAEVWLPASLKHCSHSRPRSRGSATSSAPVRRLSTNIAAMYWEAALPLVAALEPGQRRPGPRAAAMAAAVVLRSRSCSAPAAAH